MVKNIFRRVVAGHVVEVCQTTMARVMPSTSPFQVHWQRPIRMGEPGPFEHLLGTIRLTLNLHKHGSGGAQNFAFNKDIANQQILSHSGRHGTSNDMYFG